MVEKVFWHRYFTILIEIKLKIIEFHLPSRDLGNAFFGSMSIYEGNRTINFNCIDNRAFTLVLIV